MAWDGYFTLDGQEFINVARVEAYAESADANWFRAIYKMPELAPMLGAIPYTTPLLDVAPWTDPDVPESYDFYGFYPLDVAGIEDSSRASTVIQSTRDGGVPGRIRHATKTVVFNGILMGASDKAVAYGVEWLRRVLLGDHCSGDAFNHGFGTNLTYASSRPVASMRANSDPAEDLRPLLRTLRRFSVNEGPTVTSRRTIPACGGEVWTVQFTGVAGNPYQYGEERPVLQGWNAAGVSNPWVPGSTPGAISGAITHTEVACGDDVWEPIYDPLCPALIVPPAPPSIPLGCFDPPASWTRYKAVLPAENVPLWGTVVPLVTLHTAQGVRNARLRFYDDASGTLDPEATPCGFSDDLVISYIPAEGTMILDGAAEQVWVETVSGQMRRADSLVFTTEGKPFTWPSLSCGHQHIITLDVPVGSVPPEVDLSLVPRVV